MGFNRSIGTFRVATEFTSEILTYTTDIAGCESPHPLTSHGLEFASPTTGLIHSSVRDKKGAPKGLEPGSQFWLIH